MEAAARQILETFDRLGLSRLRAADLCSPARSGAAEAALAALVSSGCLREMSGHYERTELGRLEIASPLEITVLSRSGCHLCHEAYRQIEPLAGRFGAKLRMVNIDADRVLWDRYRNDVPVVFLGNREVARHRVDPVRLGAELSRLSRAG